MKSNNEQKKPFARKKFGQNFLYDQNILEKIANKSEIKEDEHILEIGTGRGALTKELDKASKYVISYEIDKDLFEENQTNLAPLLKNTKLIEGDFLKAKIPTLPDNQKYKVIANIPYYITTPIIERIIENKHQISTAIMMVQMELANRLIAKAGSKDFSSFTIFCNYYFETKKLFKVSRHCFRPVPNVESAIIQLTTREKPFVEVSDEKIFFDIVHAAFWGRRKTIHTAIKKHEATRNISVAFDQALSELGIDSKIRGEKLSVQDFANLANTVHQINSK